MLVGLAMAVLLREPLAHALSSIPSNKPKDMSGSITSQILKTLIGYKQILMEFTLM